MDPNVVTQVTSSNFVRRFTVFLFFVFFPPSHLQNKTDNIFVLSNTELRMHHISNNSLETSTSPVPGELIHGAMLAAERKRGRLGRVVSMRDST